MLRFLLGLSAIGFVAVGSVLMVLSTTAGNGPLAFVALVAWLAAGMAGYEAAN